MNRDSGAYSVRKEASVAAASLLRRWFCLFAALLLVMWVLKKGCLGGRGGIRGSN